MSQPKNPNSDEQEILAQLNRIVLLKIKALIVRNLKIEDIPKFEEIVLKNDPNLLLAYANEKTPNLAKKIYEEIDKLSLKLNLAKKLYAD